METHQVRDNPHPRVVYYFRCILHKTMKRVLLHLLWWKRVFTAQVEGSVIHSFPGPRTRTVADVRVTSFLISSEDWGQSGSSDCMLTGRCWTSTACECRLLSSSGNGGGGNESNPGNSVASTSRAARFMAFLSVASGAEMSKSGNSGGGTLASSMMH